VIEAIAFARENDLRVTVQAVGHTGEAISGGLLISTRRLDGVTVDPVRKTAAIQAGAAWADVIPEAAKHGLFPITGSSDGVSAVGYLLGGGVGPLARTHGFSSDYLVSSSVVTSTGDVIGATANDESDLFWALRGGKKVPGIVTDMTVRLVNLDTLYAGALYFEEKDIEAAFRAWVDWTGEADQRVTTSALMAQFPDMEPVPPMFRGRRILALRFAFPGPTDDGERLAAPLRAVAPVYLDDLAEMPSTQIARIHNDPTDPLPTWDTGVLLSHVDQTFASLALDVAGPGATSPFQLVEIRQIGGATARDVPEGSAVAGRSATFTFGLIAVDPMSFATVAPAAAAAIMKSAKPWTATENNINLLGAANSVTEFANVWPAPIWNRLSEIRRRYDPEGLFEYEIAHR
jgi:FAD/FMN-containing dehydrogenase